MYCVSKGDSIDKKSDFTLVVIDNISDYCFSPDLSFNLLF